MHAQMEKKLLQVSLKIHEWTNNFNKMWPRSLRLQKIS